MNQDQEYLINSRPLPCFHPIEEEYTLSPQKNYLFDLSYLGLLSIQGNNVLDFLQGQLSCDTRSVSTTQIARGAQCNLQGRILALLDVVDWHGIQLILPRDLLDLTQQSLSKTAVLSRLKLQENQNLRVFGLYLQNHEDLLPQGLLFKTEIYAQDSQEKCCCYHLGNGFYILLLESGEAADCWKSFVSQAQHRGGLLWHHLRLLHQEISIYPESRGLFLPHRLELHETSYLSFKKGCYKGQEIIARMHYRGRLKHELKRLVIDKGEAIFSGQKLSHKGIEIGEVIDYSYRPEGGYLMVASMLKTAEGY